MQFTGSERSAAVRLPTAESTNNLPERPPRTAPGNAGPLIFAITMGGFWLGAAAAYIWGYFGGGAVLALPVQQLALIAFATFAPPLFFIVLAWAFSRGQAMTFAAEQLIDSTDRLFSADEAVARVAARLGRGVRRELDALNAGLDGALTRLRALESVLEKQISALDEASARATVRTETVSAKLGEERERIDTLSAQLGENASRASELVAGRAAQLKATLEAAEGTLKNAGQLLEVQAANFRASTESAAEAPHRAAVELDKQAKAIEAVSDAAIARAEFVLGRHERHRIGMAELLQRLEQEGGAFDASVSQQRAAMEQSIGALSGQAKVFETMARETERELESIMSAGAARATELTAGFGRESERMKEISEIASASLSKLVKGLHEAGSGAQALIGQTSAQATSSAKTLVGEAMAECQKLVQTSAKLADQTNAIRQAFSVSVGEVEKHLQSLPGVAQQEAARVREVVRAETDSILDMSSRTLSTIHARMPSRVGQPVTPEQAPPAPESDGLLSRARKLTQRPKKKDAPTGNKPWEMSTLLSAVDSGETPSRELKPGTAAALGALEAALADMAVDLDAIVIDSQPNDEDWRRYLAGDRAVFARRIADAIDEPSIARISTLNRENVRFREAASIYLDEFEALLERARQGDNGGLLASTLLSADTGKIYLAVAYALGRLSG